MPTVVGVAFTANLNADKIFIDLTYLPDPINHKFWLTIRNQSLISALYFKIINNIANWTLVTPSDGKLGSVDAASTGTFTPILSRAKPSSETTDTGSLTIEAYTDSGYTNKIGEATLNVTVYFEDLEAWTDVQKFDFNDGTAQGWTLGSYMSISSEASVEVGGYSARFARQGGSGSFTLSMTRSVTLPNRAKVRMSFFWARYNNLSSDCLDGISVKVSGQKVFDIPFTIISGVTGYKGWFKISLDLSNYKGTTVTLGIEAVLTYTGSNTTQKMYVDRIVVAGKD